MNIVAVVPQVSVMWYRQIVKLRLSIIQVGACSCEKFMQLIIIGLGVPRGSTLDI